MSYKIFIADPFVKPSILQNRFYANTSYDLDLRKWCSENGIQYQSFWTLTANQHILSHSILKEIASKRKVTEAQLFFRYLTQIHIVPLIGSCSEKHMKEDLDIFSFSLTDSEMSKIEALLF